MNNQKLADKIVNHFFHKCNAIISKKDFDEVLELLNQNNRPTLKDFELNILEQCLAYCKHRLNKHINTGLHKAVKLKDVEKVHNKVNSILCNSIDEHLDEIINY